MSCIPRYENEAKKENCTSWINTCDVGLKPYSALLSHPIKQCTVKLRVYQTFTLYSSSSIHIVGGIICMFRKNQFFLLYLRYFYLDKMR